MSGLFSSLSSLSTALDAQSVGISITSKNISNINNPNYTREYVVMGTSGQVQTPQGTQAVGLQAMTVQQDASSVLDQQVISQLSLTSADSAAQDLLQQAQAGLGQSLTNATTSASSSSTAASANGLAAAISNFTNAFQSLAANPTDSGTRQALLGATSTLTQTFNSIDQNLASVQAGANQQIANNVTTANSLLGQISQINTQIEAAEIGKPGSAVDLRDQRESDLEQLANILPVTFTEQSNGEDTVTTPDASGNPVTLVQQGAVEGSIAFSNGTLTAGSPATTLALTSGSIAGTANASSGAIQSLRTSIDSLAGQIVTSVNAAYNPSGTGPNFFDPAGTTAASISLASGTTATSLVAGTGAAGDNSIALAVANLANQNFSTSAGDAIDGTFSSYYSDSVGSFGQALSNATASLDDDTSVQTMIQNQRASVSGVNMDEEMSNLIQYQRAYEATSETFGIISNLLDTVINQIGSSG